MSACRRWPSSLAGTSQQEPNSPSTTASPTPKCTSCTTMSIRLGVAVAAEGAWREAGAEESVGGGGDSALLNRILVRHSVGLASHSACAQFECG